MTEGQGATGKVEDGVTDGAAKNFIDKELSQGEADMGMVRDQSHCCPSILVLIRLWCRQSNTGMEGMAEKAADGFIDSKVDNEINENI